MKRKKNKVLMLIVMGLFGLMVSNAWAKSISIGRDVTVASSYIWRGVKQFGGTALQGTVEGSSGLLSVGLWYSSVNFGSSTLMETDPYISINLPTGPLGCSLGATYYSYDFTEFNDDADGEFELFGSIKYGALGFSAYFVPEQNSTKNDPKSSAYWIEFLGSKSIKSLEFSLLFEYGTYSSRFISQPSKDPVGDVVISTSKTLSDAVDLAWNLSFPMNTDLDRNYWLTVTYGF